MSAPVAVGITNNQGAFRGFYVHWNIQDSYGEIEPRIADRISEVGLERWVEEGIEAGGFSSAEDVANFTPYGEGSQAIEFSFLPTRYLRKDGRGPADLEAERAAQPYVNGVWEVSKLTEDEVREIAEFEEDEEEHYYLEDFLGELGYGLVVGDYAFSYYSF